MNEDRLMVITEKDWEKASAEQRDWYLFNTLQCVGSRLKVIEKRDFIYKTYSCVGGVIGGLIFWIGVKACDWIK